MMKRLAWVALLAGAVALGGGVTAHPLKGTVETRSECEDIADAKKQAACKACFTKAGAEERHYHPGGRKKGNRCHVPTPQEKKGDKTAPHASEGCGC